MTLIMIGLAVVVVAIVIHNYVQSLRKQFNTSTEGVYEIIVSLMPVVIRSLWFV